jgi:hypothetical protein
MAMAGDFEVAFSELKRVFAGHLSRLAVKKDTATEYSLNTRVPSPFPQHKGQPMWFASVRQGKAYVSFHLMPLYMNPPLLRAVSPSLKKRMQGKTCFNFKAAPEPELLKELLRLVEAAMNDWTAKKYV